MSYVQVTTTAGSREEAERIAAALLEQRAAACVQVFGPITSRYWWKGKLETAEEWVCIAKTSADSYSRVEAAIRAVHSYETPEILATAVSSGFAPYLAWVSQETRTQ
jgi:periplasmic divalent cation tolerance protein